MSPNTERVRLSHEDNFVLGGWIVVPATRELSRNETRIGIEPRVMQVLVALARARGAMTSKDDLLEACWDGRVVGEGSINRVLSLLRRLGEETGAFRIETVARVGYRLIAHGEAPPDIKASIRPAEVARRSVFGWAVAGAVGAAALAAGGGWLLFAPKRPSDRLSGLIDQADSALNYSTPEQNEAAVGIMREAVRAFPDRAEAWGRLAIAYRQQGLNSRRLEAVNTMNRAQAAARRALEIDPGNADGAVIIVVGNGLWYSSYADYDRRTQDALARFPKHELARRSRSSFLFETGRVRKSVEVAAPLVDASLPSPSMTSQAIKLWSAGRPDEAEALLNTLIERWPRHYSIWATRYKFLLFSGGIVQAEAMLSETPVGLDAIDFDILAAQTRAIKAGDAGNIDAALSLFEKAASTTSIKAQEAASFASSVRRLDTAFAYLDRIFVGGDALRSFRQRVPVNALHPHSGTMTYFLFEPPMQAVRGDPRFTALVTRLGLEEYWREAGVPDFRA